MSRAASQASVKYCNTEPFPVPPRLTILSGGRPPPPIPQSVHLLLPALSCWPLRSASFCTTTKSIDVLAAWTGRRSVRFGSSAGDRCPCPCPCTCPCLSSSTQPSGASIFPSVSAVRRRELDREGARAGSAARGAEAQADPWRDSRVDDGSLAAQRAGRSGRQGARSGESCGRAASAASGRIRGRTCSRTIRDRKPCRSGSARWPRTPCSPAQL